MKTLVLSTLILIVFQISVFSQFIVSSNHHFIEKDGKPFFWLGDTAWELFHRLNREDAEKYLKRRGEQGFTVVQAVVLAEFDGLHKPNAYGEIPFINDDPSNPNEKYFEHVDYIISLAERYHITIALLPTWGDKLFKDKWGIGSEIFNAGKPFTAMLDKIKVTGYQAYWYNPRNGKTTDIPIVPGTLTVNFTPPTSGYGQDWVLVVDDVAKNYPKP